MKTGAIIYVTGGEKIVDGFNLQEAVKKLKITADRVEVVSSRIGHYNVMDAWWMLLVKGMKNIFCITAEVTNGSELRITDHKLRLCG